MKKVCCTLLISGVRGDLLDIFKNVYMWVILACDLQYQVNVKLIKIFTVLNGVGLITRDIVKIPFI